MLEVKVVKDVKEEVVPTYVLGCQLKSVFSNFVTGTPQFCSKWFQINKINFFLENVNPCPKTAENGPFWLKRVLLLKIPKIPNIEKFCL